MPDTAYLRDVLDDWWYLCEYDNMVRSVMTNLEDSVDWTICSKVMMSPLLAFNSGLALRTGHIGH